jgi:hypothetical protein
VIVEAIAQRDARLRAGCSPTATEWLAALRFGLMAEQAWTASRVLYAIEQRDWDRLRGLLHPDVNWTTAIEEHLHGPSEVISVLAEDPVPALPAYHELRDGLVLRWIDCQG